MDANGGFRCASYGDARRGREYATQATEGLPSDRTARLPDGVLVIVRGPHGRHGRHGLMVRSRFDSD